MKSRQQPEPRAWQRMLSGRRLNLLDPSPLDVEISDIAHGLARVARWNGQTIGEHAFSVAQHSLLVLDIALVLKPNLSKELALATLLHDAPEYVIGDMISPFKAVMGGDYKVIENRLMSAIHLRFSLPAELSAADKKFIKKADMVAAYIEATELAGFEKDEALTIFGKPVTGDFTHLSATPVPTGEAQAAFLARFEELEASSSGK